MKKRKSRLPGSKLAKWALLNAVPDLADCQPDTRPYAPDTLHDFLLLYQTVFVKPDDSFGGKDVIRVHLERTIRENRPPEPSPVDVSDTDDFEPDADAGDMDLEETAFPLPAAPHAAIIALHNADSHRFPNTSAFDNWFQTVRGRRTFLIQEGIDLLPYRDSLVDIRTIAQRNQKGRWEITGMFAKQAPSGHAVTNVKAGGVAFHVNDYFRGIGYDDERQFRIRRDLETLSLRIVRQFARRYSNKLYGLDIGLERNGKLRLIEINTRPSVLILKDIDRHMFQRSAKLRWPNRTDAKPKRTKK